MTIKFVHPVIHWVAGDHTRATIISVIVVAPTGFFFSKGYDSWSSSGFTAFGLFAVALFCASLGAWLQVKGRTEQALARIFRFSHAVFSVGATVPDVHQVSTLSEAERNAFQRYIEPLLSASRLGTKFVFSDSPDAPQDTNRDLILVGGPERNKLAKVINDQLARNAKDQRYHGFYFERGELPADPQEPAEAPWCIKSAGFGQAVASFTGLPPESDRDFGFLYVGPNPLVPDRWLIWAAGIGPAGSHGAVALLGDESVRARIAEGLLGRKNYCCTLVKWEHTRGSPTTGQIAAYLLAAE